MAKGKKYQRLGVSGLTSADVMDVASQGAIVLTVNVHPRAVLVPIPRDKKEFDEVMDEIQNVMNQFVK